MASEKFANLAETTLASGYTSGTTTLSVASAAGFPTAGVFRVRLGNAGKTIWRVDSVAGTTFTGAAEANDANANSGDTCVLTATRAVAERFLQSPDAGVIHMPSGVSAVDLYGPIWKTGRPDLQSWAWQNQGTSTIVDANGVSYLTVPSASTSIRSRLLSAPGTPYIITSLLRSDYTVTGTTQNSGLVFRESGTGKLITYGLYPDGIIRATKYTNDTTFSATLGATLTTINLAGHWHWLRIKDDGTNLLFFVSRDGVNFVQVTSEGRTVFMAGGPNQIGLYANVDSAAAGFSTSFASWLQT